MCKIAVLIPCYNEAQTIGKVIDDFKKELNSAEIYIYDNNSTDDTVKIALEHKAIVKHEYKQGKGNVIRRMFREVEADCYIMVDGDDTYPASNVKEMVNLVLEKKVDMVIGDRLSSTYFTENKRPFHNTGNRMVRFLVNHFFKGDIRDIMTGYRAFSRTFVKTFPVISKEFEIETEMTIHALDKRFFTQNILVEYRDRPRGSVSKLHTIKDGVKVLKTIFSLFKDYKPMFFFGVLSFLSMFVGILFLIPVLIDFTKSGLVPRFPSLIAASFFAIISIQFFACGLILDTIVKKEKQNFELLLNEWEQKQ